MKFYKIFSLSLAIQFISCKLDNSEIISPIINSDNEIIQSSNISIEEINTDSIFVNGNKNENDTIKVKLKISSIVSHLKDLNNFQIQIYSDNENISNHKFSNSGIIWGGNIIIYSEVELIFLRSFVGKYFIKVSNVNNLSNSFITTLNIFRSNFIPEINSITMPDSVKLTDATKIISIYANATDKNGLTDLQNVKFLSFRLPDTTTIRGTFEMYDDGGKNNQSGNIDVTSSDGIYSLAIQLPSNTIKSTYRFQFIATDKSNKLSIPINKNIVIY